MTAKRATVGDIVAVVDRMAPFRLAEEWDNVGLQLGNPKARARRVGVALEVTHAVVAEAKRRRLDTLIVHHPLIFRPVKDVTADDPVGALVLELIASKIALIAAHTNLDAAPCGTNAALAETIGLRELAPMIELAPQSAAHKFVVYAPASHEQAIIEAIHRGGGGVIGAYDHCAFRSAGVGTYRPLDGATPFAGKVGRFEQADELRIEAEVPARDLGAVLRETASAHPYEEMAYDVYPRLTPAPEGFAHGAIGRLPRSTSLGALAKRLRGALGSVEPFAIVGDPKQPVRSLAVFTGAGSMAVGAWRGQADALVTGEIDHHMARDAEARGIAVLALGHFTSERPVAAFFAKRLRDEPAIAQSGIEVVWIESETAPFTRAG